MKRLEDKSKLKVYNGVQIKNQHYFRPKEPKVVVTTTVKPYWLFVHQGALSNEMCIKEV